MHPPRFSHCSACSARGQITAFGLYCPLIGQAFAVSTATPTPKGLCPLKPPTSKKRPRHLHPNRKRSGRNQVALMQLLFDFLFPIYVGPEEDGFRHDLNSLKRIYQNYLSRFCTSEDGFGSY